MLTHILNLILGYNVIGVYGHFAPRLVNLAALRGVYVWDVRHRGETLTTLCVSIRGLKRLRENMPKGVRLEVLEERGLPFLIKRYSARRVLLIGPVISALLLWGATRFVWQVEVVCSDEALAQRVETAIGDMGVRPLALRSSIKSSDIKRRMILAFPDIAWLWVEMRGSCARVSVEPRTLPPEIFDKVIPTDVAASKGGVITRVSATAGTPLRRVGDTVSEGDVLISSMGTHHARGEVWARVWYERSAAIAKEKEVRTPTGAQTHVLGVNFKKKYIKLSLNSSILYDKYDRIQNKYSIFGIDFVKDTYSEVYSEYIPCDAYAAADAFATESAAALGGEIIARRNEENENFVLTFLTIEREERIDWEIKIDGSIL